MGETGNVFNNYSELKWALKNNILQAGQFLKLYDGKKKCRKGKFYVGKELWQDIGRCNSSAIKCISCCEIEVKNNGIMVLSTI